MAYTPESYREAGLGKIMGQMTLPMLSSMVW